MSRLEKTRLFFKKYLDTRIIFMMDFVLSVAASFLAVFLSLTLAADGASNFGFNLCYLVASFIGSFIMLVSLKSYKIIIRHSNIRDVNKIFLVALGKAVIMLVIIAFSRYWKDTILMLLLADVLLTFFILFAMRVAMILTYDAIEGRFRKHIDLSKTLVYGTHNKSAALVMRLITSPHYDIVGFIVSDKKQSGSELCNRPVFYAENENDFKHLIAKKNISSILFAKEEDLQGEKEKLVGFAIDNNVRIYLAPSIDESPDGTVHTSIREVRIEDLLGREEIKISLDRIRQNFSGKVVMVTGAAGSIGSELCRQLATLGVGRLILYDNNETPMHELRLSLEEKYPNLKFVPLIGDVRYERRLDYAFRKYQPQVVFHAAAYKHVPLMEENPCEAVMANVYGSSLVADKCIEYGVEKMVMISTDKAVNPTNIMGCSKRLAELYVQSLGNAVESGEVKGTTKFVTTRFGNVLGSHGSVIPRFREQIAKGGPVTVTHPDIIRFFMTIPEACRLVMEAATLSEGNNIFVFDMGRSVKIDTLARRMIRLSGYEPDIDIKIEYTGLRPGEKLYEEVLADLEGTLPTSHDRIRVASVRPYEYSAAREAVDKLAQMAVDVNIEDMVRYMKETVPEYKSNNSVFEKFDKK